MAKLPLTAEQHHAAAAVTGEHRPQPPVIDEFANRSAAFISQFFDQEAKPASRLPEAVKKSIPTPEPRRAPSSGKAGHQAQPQAVMVRVAEGPIVDSSDLSQEQEALPRNDTWQPAPEIKSAVIANIPVEQPAALRLPENSTPVHRIFELVSVVALPATRSQSAAHNLKLAVHSEELGPIHLDLKLRGNKLTLRIETRDVQTATVLERDGELLTRLLAEVGLEASTTIVVDPQAVNQAMPDKAESPRQRLDFATAGDSAGRQPAADRHQPRSTFAGNDGSAHHETSSPSNDTAARRRGIYL
ncbi:MAG: flagellar hook-length control protein FliK [Rhizobiales bacterium]|nr:flagellar hook-length control protein FliK [Hyphomicrobiales bacterium]MBI3672768.1 flagellar hook-length control protein FliK [Hyphomicrobiales bacterium]